MGKRSRLEQERHHATGSAEAAPAPDAARASRVAAAIPWAILCAITGFFLLTRSFALSPHAADEGIYFYAASRMVQGLLPYRDFFHAHPPLHLLPTAGLFALFGYSMPIAKAPTFLLTALQGPAIFLIVRRLLARAPSTTRDAAALLAVLLLLFCESTLKASANDTGICQASGVVALAAVLLVYGKPIAAGIAAGCAPLILLQSAPTAALVAGAAFLLDRRSGVKTTLAAAGIVLLVHAIFYVWAGTAFIQQVYLFHFDKLDAPGEGARQLGFVLFDNWNLFACAATGGLALALAGRQGRVWCFFTLGASVLTFVAMATRPRVFPFYFLPAFFPAALAAALGWAEILARASSWIGSRVRKQPAVAPIRALIPAAAGIALLTFLQAPLAGTISPQREQQVATYAQTYQWLDGPGLGFLNPVVRELFWQDGERKANTDPNCLTQYLWQRSRGLDIFPDVVSEVKKQASAFAGTTLFGDSTLTPLVALEAGVRITSDVIDTNMQRITAGHLPIREVLAMLDTHPAAMVLAGGRGIGTVPEFQQYLASHLRPIRQFNSKYAPPVVLYARR